LTAHGALAAHVRDELGVSAVSSPHPVQAALASAASFAVGAAVPVVVVGLAGGGQVLYSVMASSLVFLGFLGFAAARVGGANVAAGICRVMFWGALAMATTAGVGALVGRAG